jgi:hypothetical protein
MRLWISALLAVLLVLGSQEARADEPATWSTSFDTPALGTYVPAEPPAIIVVAAGPSSPELRSATDALGAALRHSGRASSVLDDASLGELGPVDDATVLTRVRSLPVTHVAIVRLLAGDPPKALVSFYAKGGHEPIASLIATVGMPIAPGVVESEPQAGSGVSKAAVDKVGDLQEESKADENEARLRYRNEFVGYDGIDITITGGNGWSRADVKTRFYLGELKQPLDGADFYKAVDRDDLAGEYETRDTTRNVLMVGGIALAVASLIPLTQYQDCDIFGPEGTYDACTSSNEDLMIWATVLVGVGGLSFTVGHFMNADPVDDAARRNLAEEHNAGLKTGLHLDARAGKPHRRAWNLRPSVGRSYQGVSLALSF